MLKKEYTENNQIKIYLKDSLLYFENNKLIKMEGLIEQIYSSELVECMINSIDNRAEHSFMKSIELFRRKLFRSTNKSWFFIKDIDSGMIKTKLKSINTFIKINPSSIDMIDINDIDKFYIWSILFDILIF